MAGPREQQTFEAMLRDLPGPAESVGQDFVPRDPDGVSMSSPRRMTIKQARRWIRRDEIPLGVWPCAPAIQWLSGAGRAAFAAQLRRREGADCNLRGDALLFTMPQGRHALVIENL